MAMDCEIRPFESCIRKVKYTNKIASQDFKDSGRFPIVSQEEAFISGYWDDPKDVFYIDSPIVVFGDHSRHVKYVDFDFVIGADGVIILAPVKDIDAKYLYYYLKSQPIQSLGYSRHYKVLKEKKVPVPSLSDQRRIVDELDLLSGIIEKKNAQLRTLDELASTIFYEMFGDPITNERGWETANLSTLVTDKKAVKRAARHFLPNDVIHYIDIASIDNISHRMTSTTEVTFCEAPSRAQQIVENGDVLVSMVRPNLRNVASVCSGDNNLVASSGFCVLRSTSFNGEFVRQLVLSDFFTDYLLTRVSGANYPAVREEDIRECIIGIPPIEMQQAFSEKMRSIEKQRLLIDASLNTVKNLLASRMDKYFNE